MITKQQSSLIYMIVCSFICWWFEWHMHRPTVFVQKRPTYRRNSFAWKCVPWIHSIVFDNH